MKPKKVTTSAVKQIVLYLCNCPFYWQSLITCSGVNDDQMRLVRGILAKLLEVATTMGKHGKEDRFRRRTRDM